MHRYIAKIQWQILLQETEVEKLWTKRGSPWRDRQSFMWCRHEPENAWNCQKSEETRKDSSTRTSEGARHCWHCDFGLLASRNLRVHFCALNHQISGNSLQYPLIQLPSQMHLTSETTQKTYYELNCVPLKFICWSPNH